MDFFAWRCSRRCNVRNGGIFVATFIWWRRFGDATGADLPQKDFEILPKTIKNKLPTKVPSHLKM